MNPANVYEFSPMYRGSTVQYPNCVPKQAAAKSHDEYSETH